VEHLSSALCLPVEQGHREEGLTRISEAGYLRNETKARVAELTAMNVAGRKTIVRRAIAFIDELSRFAAFAMRIFVLLSFCTIML
jgi:hypothetical protein